MLDARSSGQQFAEIQRQAAQSRVKALSVYWDTYARDDETDTPYVAESHLADCVLMDPTGDCPRVLRSEVDPDAFDDAADDAVPLTMRLSMHAAQEAPLRNRSSKIVATMSGARQGKTMLMAIRAVMCWIEQGGPGINIGWLAPTRKATRLAVRALVTGTRETPGLIPKELVVYYPKKVTSPDQYIELIDGTTIWLNHGSGDGSNLRGDEMVLYLIDEITAIKDEQNFDHALDRTSRTRGQVFIASTPIKNHWARQRLVVADNDRIAVYKFTGEDNVWFPRAAFWEWVESKGGRRNAPLAQQPPYVRRECFGEWDTDGSPAFPCWDPGLHKFTTDTHDCADLGYENITAQATAQHFSNHSEVFGGQDFNDRNHTAVICQVGVRPGDDASDWQNWHFFVFEEYQTEKFIEDHAADLAAALRKDFGAEPCALAIDATSADRPGSTRVGAGYHSTGGSLMRAAGFDALAPMYTRNTDGVPVPHNPRQADSLNFMNWLLRRGRVHVSERARLLMRGLTELQRSTTGGIEKKSAPGSVSDIISDPVDCVRYATWAVAGQRWLTEVD